MKEYCIYYICPNIKLAKIEFKKKLEEMKDSMGFNVLPKSSIIIYKRFRKNGEKEKVFIYFMSAREIKYMRVLRVDKYYFVGTFEPNLYTEVLSIMESCKSYTSLQDRGQKEKERKNDEQESDRED